MIRKPAVLVTYPDRSITQEALGLAEAAGYEVKSVVTQNYLSRAKYGVGSGKAEEIRQTVSETGASAILFDEKLHSVQIYNLTKLAGVETIDREKLILEIFNKRAASGESKLQVKLAELNYEMPRSREKVRLAKMGEQPGFFGLGGYEVDVYYRAIRRRLSTLSRKREVLSKRRELFRRQRQRTNVPVVSLAGYTGVGKTTVFNELAGEAKQVGVGAFTTLATTTRSADVTGSRIFLSDTVGFISRLPAYMIEAFKSTLEELRYSNLVLLVIDVSEDPSEIIRKYETSVSILSQLDVSPSKVLLVFNKADLVDPASLERRIAAVGAGAETCAVISAKTGQGMDKLQQKTRDLIFEYAEYSTPLTVEEVNQVSDYIDWAKKNAEVELIKQASGELIAQIRGPAWVVERFRGYRATNPSSRR